MRVIASVLVYMGFRGVILALILLGILTLALQNLEPVTFDLFFWTFAEVPKMYLIVGCTGAGLLMGMIIGFMAGRWRGVKVTQKALNPGTSS